MNTLASITAVMFCILVALTISIIVNSPVVDPGYTEFVSTPSFNNVYLIPEENFVPTATITPTPTVTAVVTPVITPTPLYSLEDYYTSSISTGIFSTISINPTASYTFAEDLKEVTLTFKGIMKIDRMYFTDDNTTVLEMKR